MDFSRGQMKRSYLGFSYFSALFSSLVGDLVLIGGFFSDISAAAFISLGEIWQNGYENGSYNDNVDFYFSYL